MFDLGEALYGFLLRYGEEFDYHGGGCRVRLGGLDLPASLARTLFHALPIVSKCSRNPLNLLLHAHHPRADFLLLNPPPHHLH